MSKREQLNLYIQQVQQRLRLDASLRGAAVVTLAALVATVVLTLILNAYAFPERGLTPARLALLAVVAGAVCAGLAWPLWRLTRRSPYIVSGLRRAGFDGGWLQEPSHAYRS